MRRRFYRIEVVSGGIQVEHHLIRIIELARAAEPDMRGHAGLICKIDQRGGIVAEDVRDGAPHLLHGHGLYPAGIVSWHGLVKKTGFVDSVRVTFHRQWPAPE